MSHLATASTQVSSDQFYEEEVNLFSKTGTGIAEGSSVSSCDYCYSDSDSDSA